MATIVTPPRPEDAITSGKMSALQIGAVALCVLINALDGFDVLAVAFTAAPISREWGLSPTDVGALFSVGLAGMGVGAFFLSPLGDKFGRRPMILACLVILAVGMLLSALTTSLGGLLWMRFITGLGIGGMLASINTIVAEYATAKRRNLCISLMALGYPLGAAFGGLAAVPLINAFGWHSVYLMGGVAAIVLIPLALWLIPESVQFLITRRPRKALERINSVMRRIDRPELTVLPERDLTGLNRPQKLSAVLGPDLLRTTVLVLILNITVMMTVYFAVSWTPKILSELGFSDSIGIYASLMMNLSGAVGCLLFGLMANRFGLRRLSALVFVALGLALTAFGLVPPVAGALIIAAFVLGFFINTAITCLYTILPTVFPAGVRATGTGIGLGGGRIGAVAGPYLAGVLIAAGWDRSAFCIALALPMIIAVMALFGLKQLERPRQEGGSPISEPAAAAR